MNAVVGELRLLDRGAQWAPNADGNAQNQRITPAQEFDDETFVHTATINLYMNDRGVFEGWPLGGNDPPSSLRPCDDVPSRVFSQEDAAVINCQDGRPDFGE
jgi:hypothetical protein